MTGPNLLALDRAATVAGVTLLGATALLAPVLAAFEGMQSNACTLSCDAGMVGAGSGVIALGPAICLTAVIVVVLGVRRPGRPLAWVGLLGLAATTGTVVLGIALITGGIGG
ncbi:hypothetical protein [Amnibacterium endophyticum]|uniref:Uncharacterized protein n=1 Tax=Amnibacterium endophyticum TaxID=2109337 RepID=A0ABW4LAX0_9MICO